MSKPHRTRVTRVEAGNGFQVRCDCGWTAMRGWRATADVAALEHAQTHGEYRRGTSGGWSE